MFLLSSKEWRKNFRLREGISSKSARVASTDTRTCRQLEHRAQHEQTVQVQGDRAHQYTPPVPTYHGETWLEEHRRGMAIAKRIMLSRACFTMTKPRFALFRNENLIRSLIANRIDFVINELIKTCPPSQFYLGARRWY